MRSIHLLSLLVLAGGPAPVRSAEVALNEDHGYIPYLAPPSRPMPAGFAAAEFGTNGGVICGDVALIPKKNAWGGSYAVEAAFRWQNGSWQAGVPWLPADRWPGYVRHGFLVYLSTDPDTNHYVREFVDASTGEVKWTVDDWIGEADGFDVNEHAVVFRGHYDVVVHPLGGEPLTIPGSSSVRRILLDGRELAIFSQINWSVDQLKLERWSIDTGESLGSWTLNGSYKLFAFHDGKALVGKPRNHGRQVELLVPGEPEPRVLELPEAVQPGSRIVPTNEVPDPPPNARTPTGVWLNLAADGNARAPLLHCDLSGSEPSWSLGIDGIPVYNNGYRIVTRTGNGAPLFSDANPAVLPMAYLLPSRGRELSGVLPVKVRLDRPSAATVKVRVASRNGGTATPGADYTVFDQWISFPPGTMEAEGSLTLAEDFTPEPHETVLLEILGTENAHPPIEPKAVGVIEASGVQQQFVTYPEAPANPGTLSSSVTGGDGLGYRVLGEESLSIYDEIRNRIEVSDPLTGTVLEVVTLRLDSEALTPTGLYYNGVYAGDARYSVGGSLKLRATADGVACRYATSSPIPLEWRLSSRRDYPAFTFRLGNPVEGGAAGLVEFQACERTESPASARLKLTTPNFRDTEYYSNHPFSLVAPADITIPADGSVLPFDLPIQPWQWTSRSTPIRMLFRDASGLMVEDTYLEPAPGDYVPETTVIPLDPVLTAGRVGHFTRRGDSLWVAFPRAVNPVTRRKTGCVQELDATTHAVKRTIWAPVKLKHGGFGERLIDAGHELIILAHEYDDRSRARQTVCILDVATGTYRAVIPWTFWDTATIVFDDSYLVISSASDQDGRRKTAGGLTLYSRATYKPLGKVKFSGVGTGKGVALSGGVLWVGVPGAEWRPEGLPKRHAGQLFSGAVMRYGALPSLRNPRIFQSPDAGWAPHQFGSAILAADDGAVLVRATTRMYRIDASGQFPATRAPGSALMLPVGRISRSDGLRSDFYHSIFDERTGLRFADFEGNGPNALTHKDFLFSSWDMLFSVPYERCGSFELWQRYAPEIPGDTRPDIQRYVEEHLGSLPEVTVTPKYAGYRSKVIVAISTPLPPDVTMLVEYSIAGDPWQVAALRHGTGPVRNRKGEAIKNLPNQVETVDDLPARGIRFRARYDRTTAMSLGLLEYRHHYVKP